MKRLSSRLSFLAVLGLFAVTVVARADANEGPKAEAKPEANAKADGKAAGKTDGKADAKEKKRPMVQIAILLDNSGSMSGLINQARSELWTVVNEFVNAKRGGVRPELQVAVYHYGRPPATQLVALTDDLDRVSEALFGIPVSGGSEYYQETVAHGFDIAASVFLGETSYSRHVVREELGEIKFS